MSVDVDVVITADNTDVLAGTDLDQIPANGVLVILACSTQQDTGLTITLPGGAGVQAPMRGIPITMRANAEIRQDQDPQLVLPILQGGHATLNADITTAATARLRAKFVPAQTPLGRRLLQAAG